MPRKASKNAKSPKTSKPAANGGKPKVNKSEWIRSQPKDMAASAVVEKAKAEGIEISTAFVYTARSNGKGGNKAAKGKPGRPKGSKNIGKEIAGDLTALRRAVFTHGFEKVEGFLADLKKSVGL